MKGLAYQQLRLKSNTVWRLQYLLALLKKHNQKKVLVAQKNINSEKPLVYSCSGCSSAAQMANYIALQLDRNGVAEMSCIVGVGGNVKKLVHQAFSGRKLITIDGCPLACSKACLGNHSLKSDLHFELTGMGVKKRNHEDFDPMVAFKMLKKIKQQVIQFEQVT